MATIGELIEATTLPKLEQRTRLYRLEITTTEHYVNISAGEVIQRIITSRRDLICTYHDLDCQKQTYWETLKKTHPLIKRSDIGAKIKNLFTSIKIWFIYFWNVDKKVNEMVAEDIAICLRNILNKNQTITTKILEDLSEKLNKKIDQYKTFKD